MLKKHRSLFATQSCWLNFSLVMILSLCNGVLQATDATEAAFGRRAPKNTPENPVYYATTRIPNLDYDATPETPNPDRFPSSHSDSFDPLIKLLLNKALAVPGVVVNRARGTFVWIQGIYWLPIAVFYSSASTLAQGCYHAASATASTCYGATRAVTGCCCKTTGVVTRDCRQLVYGVGLLTTGLSVSFLHRVWELGVWELAWACPKMIYRLFVNIMDEEPPF